MKIIKNKNIWRIVLIISIPIFLIAQFYLFKMGILSPLIKGIDINVVSGEYIKDIDKIVIKQGENIKLDKGEYVIMPSYAKGPNLEFKILDNTGILSINHGIITGVKAGHSSVGILKGSRLLKQVEIMVIDPTIQDVYVSLSNDLKYVGDKANISSLVEMDYKRFNEKKTVEVNYNENRDVKYISSNEDILKINGNKVEAVGVGKATITAQIGNKEKVLTYKIEVMVESIEVDELIKLNIGQFKEINPQIITSPKNLKHPKVKFKLLKKSSDIIKLSSDGSVVGLKEGEEKIKIICGNLSETITVKVVKDSIIDKIIKNLVCNYEIIDNKLRVTLSWDYTEDIYDYDVYLKNNTENNSNFKVIKNVSISSSEIPNDKRITTSFDLDMNENNVFDFSLYVIGKNKDNTTKQSEITSIKSEDVNPPKEELTLGYTIDESSKLINLTWNSILSENVTYSVYVKDISNGEIEFSKYESGISDNSFNLSNDKDKANLEIYVVAEFNGQEYLKSNIVSINQ